MAKRRPKKVPGFTTRKSKKTEKFKKDGHAEKLGLDRYVFITRAESKRSEQYPFSLDLAIKVPDYINHTLTRASRKREGEKSILERVSEYYEKNPEIAELIKTEVQGHIKGKRVEEALTETEWKVVLKEISELITIPVEKKLTAQETKEIIDLRKAIIQPENRAWFQGILFRYTIRGGDIKNAKKIADLIRRRSYATEKVYKELYHELWRDTATPAAETYARATDWIIEQGSTKAKEVLEHIDTLRTARHTLKGKRINLLLSREQNMQVSTAIVEAIYVAQREIFDYTFEQGRLPPGYERARKFITERVREETQAAKSADDLEARIREDVAKHSKKSFAPLTVKKRRDILNLVWAVKQDERELKLRELTERFTQDEAEHPGIIKAYKVALENSRRLYGS